MDRLTPLTAAALGTLPPADDTAAPHDDLRHAELRWARAAERSLGCVGFAIRAGVDDPAPIADLLWAPPRVVPPDHPQALAVRGPLRRLVRAPRTDAPVILRLRLPAGGDGLGRALVQHALAHLARTPWRGLQVRTTRARPTWNLPDHDQLLGWGFHPLPARLWWQADPLHPWLAIDLRRTQRATPLAERMARWVPRPVMQTPTSSASRRDIPTASAARRSNSASRAGIHEPREITDV